MHLKLLNMFSAVDRRCYCGTVWACLGERETDKFNSKKANTKNKGQHNKMLAL